MGYTKILALLITVVLIGCSGKTAVAPVKDQRGIEVSSNTVPPIMVPKKSSIKVFDPLAGKKFTFSANNVPVQSILYTISMDTGLNLVISPDVTLSSRISANFVNTPMKDALEIVMDMGNIFYEVKGNMLKISKYNSYLFSVPYIATTGSYNAALGGDLIGATDKDSSTNLKGEFSMEYAKSSESSDFYTQIEENINNIIEGDGSVIVNTVSGIISVKTTYNRMKQVENFLDNSILNAVRQVQIEAKIMEVVLKDSNSYGINWNQLFSSQNKVSYNQGNIPFVGNFVLSLASNLEGVLSVISTYGKVDTLANPRLTMLNGQQAMISAGKIVPYWDKKVEKDKDGAITVTYEKFSVLDGLAIGMTAYVHDDDTVMLNVVPITSAIEGTADMKDGGLVVAEAPILNIKEAGTSVQVEDGSVVIIGGLITNAKKVDTSGIPVLSSIPIIGYLFSQETVSYEKRELVILIKPTIVTSKSRVVRR